MDPRIPFKLQVAHIPCVTSHDVDNTHACKQTVSVFPVCDWQVLPNHPPSNMKSPLVMAWYETTTNIRCSYEALSVYFQRHFCLFAAHVVPINLWHPLYAASVIQQQKVWICQHHASKCDTCHGNLFVLPVAAPSVTSVTLLKGGNKNKKYPPFRFTLDGSPGLQAEGLRHCIQELSTLSLTASEGFI